MKKILFTIIKVIIGVLVVTGVIFHNLKSKSVYYAKNMPRGEGQKPELIMLIDNLWWVYTPDIDGIKYKIDGTRDIIDVTNNYKSFGNIYSDETEYIYSDGNNVSYSFNRKFQLIHVFNVRKWERIDINSIDQKKLIEDIEAFVKPIIDEQNPPFINLQWLFNLLYQDEFK